MHSVRPTNGSSPIGIPSRNEGARFFDAPNPAVLPRFASAQCQGGTLVVSEIGKPPCDFMSKLLDHALGPENYHPMEYQIFYLSLRRNAQTRVAAYLVARTGVN